MMPPAVRRARSGKADTSHPRNSGIASRACRAGLRTGAASQTGQFRQYAGNEHTNATVEVAQAIEQIGGRYKDRTCDPYHVKVVLYR